MNNWFRLPLRVRLGIIAAVMLTFAVVLVMFWIFDPNRLPSYRFGWVIRFAPPLFLFWLAWTDIKRIPWWGWLAMPVIVLVCAVKPPLWFIGIPIIAYLLFTGYKTR